MQDNTVVLIVAEVFLGILGIVSLYLGQKDLAEISAGAFVGLVGGHLNGRQA